MTKYFIGEREIINDEVEISDEAIPLQVVGLIEYMGEKNKRYLIYADPY